MKTKVKKKYFEITCKHLNEEFKVGFIEKEYVEKEFLKQLSEKIDYKVDITNVVEFSKKEYKKRKKEGIY